MTGYTGSAAGPFNSSIGLVDTTDIVQGGLGGVSNVATKALADNDAYLYKIMGGFESVVTLSNAGPITTINISAANLKRNLVLVYQVVDGYFECVLPACSTVRTGEVACIKRLPVGHFKPVKVSAFAGEIIYGKYGESLVSKLYLHDGECVWVYNTGSEWVLLNNESNYYRVGEQYLGYRQQQGTLIRNGAVVNRADYPRLWNMVNGIGSPLLVSEATWLSDASGYGLFENKSRFSSGDGSTTFRLPDDRGMFDRAMTYAGGRDADRVTAGVGSNVGDVQGDEVRAHTHGINVPVFVGSAGVGSGAHADAGATASYGGSETRPINVAKVPLLVY